MRATGRGGVARDALEEHARNVRRVRRHSRGVRRHVRAVVRAPVLARPRGGVSFLAKNAWFGSFSVCPLDLSMTALASEVGTGRWARRLRPQARALARRPISGSSRACRGIAMGRRTGRGASATSVAASFAPRWSVLPVAWTAVALMAPLAVGGADPEFTLAYPPPPPPGPTAPSYVPRWVTRSVRAMIPRVVPDRSRPHRPRPPSGPSDADEKCCRC